MGQMLISKYSEILAMGEVTKCSHISWTVGVMQQELHWDWGGILHTLRLNSLGMYFALSYHLHNIVLPGKRLVQKVRCP